MRNILFLVIALTLCTALFLIFKNDNIENRDLAKAPKESVIDTSETVIDTSKTVIYYFPVKKGYSEIFFNTAVNMLKTSEKDSTCYSYKLMGPKIEEREEPDTTKLVLFQAFINEEAFNEQLNSDYFKAFKDTIADMLYQPLDSCRKPI